MPENYLIHIGNKNSGRYPRGSGENPGQHEKYGTMGKMSRKQIKKAAKTWMSEYDKVYADTANKYNKKHYGTDDTTKLTDEQIFKATVRGEEAANKYMLNKYGTVNQDKIADEYNNPHTGRTVAGILSLFGAVAIGTSALAALASKK